MPRLLRWTLRLIAGLAVLVLVLAGAVAGLVWNSLPGGDHSAAIPGLAAPVAIEIDADSIPRIRAASMRDAAAALGYLHARERLFQMDLMRRAAAGEISEIAGPATLPLDRMMRVLGVRRSAAAVAAALDADTRAMLEAYASGVNAWMGARGRFAAAEFVVLGAPRPWTPTDSLLWAKTMGLYLSGNWRTELERARPGAHGVWPGTAATATPHAALDPAVADFATKLAALLPRFPDPFTLPASASNAWAVDGRHSATGAPLLAGDPHLGFALPGTWYLARIETPEGVLAGATAPGVPMMVLGHNNRIAWSFTTTGADVQDLFIESPAGEGHYMTPEGPRPFTLREERIAVRGQADEVLRVRETRHGPVVSDLVSPDGPVLAAAMANLTAPDTAAAGLLALNRAPDVAAAGRAAALISTPVQNMIVADRQGIALFLTGRVPVRRAGDGSAPVPGADGGHDWVGWASGSALPHIVAPASGRLVNANERVAPEDFPVFLGRDWHDDLRARRARALLAATPQHTVESFAAMQVDDVSLFARDTLPRLAALPVPDGPARGAQALLAGWDGRMAEALPQPLLFNAWMQRFARALSPGGAAPWWHLAAYALSSEGAGWCAAAAGPAGCDGLLSRTLQATLDDLAGRYGADPAAWRWGEAHQAVFAHPLLRFVAPLRFLAVVRSPSAGDATTLLRANTGGTGFDAVHGAGFRAVYDLADLDRSRFVVAPGQSGHIVLASARDFVERWRAGGSVSLGPQAGRVAVRLTLTPLERTP